MKILSIPHRYNKRISYYHRLKIDSRTLPIQIMLHLFSVVKYQLKDVIIT